MPYDTESKIRLHQIMIDQLPLAEGLQKFCSRSKKHSPCHLSWPSQSQIDRQIGLFAFYDLRNDNSRRRNRHNLCLCGSGGNVLRQFCFEPLLSCLFLLYQATRPCTMDNSQCLHRIA
jgi:hypothetical protein